MGWNVIREREDNDCRMLKKKVREVQYLMDDICKMVEEDTMSERDEWEDGMMERRGMRGTGRYSRY